MTPPQNSPTPPARAPAQPPTVPPQRRRGRTVAASLFAVIAAGLVVAAATVLPFSGPTAHDADLLESRMPPSMYAMQAASALSDLGALPALPVDGVGGAAGLDVAQQEAVASLEQAIEEAMAALDAELAARALPEIPEGFVPGTDVDVDLPSASPYPLPSLGSPDLGLDALRLHEVALSGSPVGAQSGSSLDGVLDQLAGLQGQLSDLLGQDLPLEGMGGLPVGGPAPVEDADGTVEPDEAGASAASLHALGALDATSGAYASTASQLEALLALYEQLSAKVEQAIETAHDLQADAEQDIDDLLQERLDAIEAQSRTLEATAKRLVAQHAKAVASAQSDAMAAIDQATGDGTRSLNAMGQAQVRDLQAKADAILADGQRRKAEIDAIVQSATLELGSDPEAAEALQAVQAAAAAATVQVDRESKAQAAAVLAQVAPLQQSVTDATGRIQQTGRDAQAQVNETVRDALSGEEDVREYLMAVAQAQAQGLAEREARLAREAVSDLQAQVDEHVEALVDEALGQASAAQQKLTLVTGIVGDAEGMLVGEVGKDLDYVAKVGEDYGRIPTEDRKARAVHWSGVALQLGDVLEKTLADGRSLESLADDVLAAARLAAAEVEALA